MLFKKKKMCVFSTMLAQKCIDVCSDCIHLQEYFRMFSSEENKTQGFWIGSIIMLHN